jgi:hypothetical protein
MQFAASRNMQDGCLGTGRDGGAIADAASGYYGRTCGARSDRHDRWLRD